MLCLRYAACLGDSFKVDWLEALFARFSIDANVSVTSILRSIERRGLIEIVMEGRENYYRFEKGFIRETIYESMIQAQKKEVHQDIVEFLKNTSVNDWTTNFDHLKEEAILLHHVMEAEGVK